MINEDNLKCIVCKNKLRELKYFEYIKKYTCDSGHFSINFDLDTYEKRKETLQLKNKNILYEIHKEYIYNSITVNIYAVDQITSKCISLLSFNQNIFDFKKFDKEKYIRKIQILFNFQ